MSNNRKPRHWPLIERISPKAAALLNEEIEPIQFNAGWLFARDDQPSHRGSTYSNKHSKQK
jgi:hypothetical protein